MVSPTYADEVCTAYYGEGMDGIFRQRRSILYGILNGIDPTQFDPTTDEGLAQHFSASDLSRKVACKLLCRRNWG